jgi:hypothetical protein
MAGMAAQAISLLWIGTLATAGSTYASLLPAFILGGLGMGLCFSPLSATVIRELGGVFGIAVLGAVFAAVVRVPAQFVEGFHVALRVAAGILAGGALISVLLPNVGMGRAKAEDRDDKAEAAA